MPEITKPKATLVYDEKELKIKDFVTERILQLKDTRKNVFGVDLEKVWRQADKDYLPHRLGKKGTKLQVIDEELGWASRKVEVGRGDWQTDNSQPNPYIKIQTAIALLIGKNPEAVFSPGSSKFEAVTLLQKELYKKSWETAKSLQQLKLFVFNLAKYGWACARTYPLILKKVNRILVEYNEDDPEKSKYEYKEATEYNGIFRENLDPWRTWIDDMAKPNDMMSVRDWCYAKDYSYDVLKQVFGTYKNFEHIDEGTSEKAEGTKESVKEYVSKNIKTAYFYENKVKDLLTVIVDGIMLVNEPLPIADTDGNKKLSLWHAYWTLRHAESPYGIGIPEVIRPDQNLLDKIRNMTMDQLILSIYKMFFYEGTEQMDESGEIRIRPGVGKQMVNPQNMKWLDVPGPGKESWNAIEILQKDLEEACGITKPLSGEALGKTAYESAQSTEFSLRRLNTPLDNVTDALEQDAILTQIINEMIYSVPEMVAITDTNKIMAYLDEVKGDAELYGRNEEGDFVAKLYKEVELGIELDKEGKLIEAEKSRFFRIKPRFLKWQGIIRVKGQSVMFESKAIAKQLKLEFFNVIVPLLQGPPEVFLKPVKQLCKIYDEDFKVWVPDAWTQPPQPAPLMMPQAGAPPGTTPPQAPQGAPVPQGGNMAMPTVLPKSETDLTKKNIVTQAAGKIGKFFGQFGR